MFSSVTTTKELKCAHPLYAMFARKPPGQVVASTLKRRLLESLKQIAVSANDG